MKVFLSYSTKDKLHAGKIKREIETHGIDAFLAHDDIEPSVEWAEKILKELRASHVFLPLLTKNFYKSYWTGQETGIAFELHKLIVPLKVDKINPHGFISRFQALTVSESTLRRSCNKLIETLAGDPKTAKYYRDTLIQKFAGSYDFYNAGDNAEQLEEQKNYSVRQMREILRATIKNDQIYRSWKAQRFLKKLYSNYKMKSSIGSKLVRDFKRTIS
jgi:hypothetical protein